MSNLSPTSVKFRNDINGLRAWAVIAVVLFHFNLIELPGGFTGVDIFFVISGYLMTAIIVDGHEKGDFSIWQFYLARARRILPALSLVVAVLLGLGWFWLSPPDYRAIGSQSIYGMSFLSNIFFWKSAGYFDSTAEEKWLLHTWTLAIEVQFYLLYPIFLALIYRFCKSLKAITIGVLFLFISSLALNLVVTDWRPNAAFYLLPTRGWELAAGGLVYLITIRKSISAKFKKNINWIGWSLIFFSFFFITEHLAWPGYWAIIPVLGSSLVILGQRDNCKFTNHYIAQWLGDRSYSLYLWHWPIFVSLYFAGLQNHMGWLAGALISSILIAHLSYKYVESTSRHYLVKSTSINNVISLFSVSTLIILFAIFVKTDTFDQRIPNKVKLIANESNNFYPDRDRCEYKGESGYLGCKFNKHQKLGAILVGDSHAISTLNPINIVLERVNKNGIVFHHNWCPIIDGLTFTVAKHNHRKCYAFNNFISHKLKSLDKTAPLIIVNSYLYFLDSRLREVSLNNEKTSANLSRLTDRYVKTVCNLGKDRAVFLVRPYPNMDYAVPDRLSRNYMFENYEDIKVPLSRYLSESKNLRQMQDSAAEKCGATILDPLPYLCDDKFCYGSQDGRALYYDHSHLSEHGNRLLIPMFEQVLN